jgi:hypothetical protein
VGPWRCIGCFRGNLKIHLRSVAPLVNIFEEVFNHVHFVAPFNINMRIILLQ